MGMSPRQVKSFTIWFSIHGGLILGASALDSQGLGEMLLGTSAVLMGIPLFVCFSLGLFCWFRQVRGRLSPSLERSSQFIFDVLFFSFVASLPWVFVWKVLR